MKIRNCKRWAFTLIELLVVITIIALLMSILMPSLGKAREQSRQAVCGTNLHAVGQGIYIYAHEHDDLLVPGNFSIPWAVWGNSGRTYEQVNLGFLMTANAVPMPDSDRSVYFCPSMTSSLVRQTSGQEYFDCETFQAAWGQANRFASVSYMYNTALDGFGNTVANGKWGILSHSNRVQYLLADGSVHAFKIVPLVYDSTIGPELLQQVCQRRGLNFPSVLLHKWFVKGEVDLNEAQAYLANPAVWMNTYADSALEETARRTKLSQVANASLVSDVAGAWDSPAVSVPPVPG
jgi:prepilin-type N-terminal cleavage/methylation domain-containing protein/prepilin-type processing-associated H-X9-DG protein